MTYSPTFLTDLVTKIIEKINEEYNYDSKYTFIELCSKQYNFKMQNEYYEDGTSSFSLYQTIKHLACSDEDTLIAIALELGIEVPNVIYSLKEIQVKLDENNFETARKYLDEACQKIYKEPHTAWALANTCLETITKHILEDDRIKDQIDYKEKDTLYDLTQKILKAFEHYPSKEIGDSIKNIGSSFMTIAKSIENVRSENTDAHGKSSTQIIIEEPIYSTLAINSVITVGLFLLEFYEKKYPKPVLNDFSDDDDVPF